MLAAVIRRSAAGVVSGDIHQQVPAARGVGQQHDLVGVELPAAVTLTFTTYPLTGTPPGMGRPVRRVDGDPGDPSGQGVQDVGQGGEFVGQVPERGHQAPSRSPRDVLTVFSARRAVGTLKGTIRRGGWSVVADIARTCLRPPLGAAARCRHSPRTTPAWRPMCEILSIPPRYSRGTSDGPRETPVPNAALRAAHSRAPRRSARVASDLVRPVIVIPRRHSLKTRWSPARTVPAPPCGVSTVRSRPGPALAARGVGAAGGRRSTTEALGDAGEDLLMLSGVHHVPGVEPDECAVPTPRQRAESLDPCVLAGRDSPRAVMMVTTQQCRDRRTSRCSASRSASPGLRRWGRVSLCSGTTAWARARRGVGGGVVGGRRPSRNSASSPWRA